MFVSDIIRLFGTAWMKGEWPRVTREQDKYFVPGSLIVNLPCVLQSQCLLTTGKILFMMQKHFQSAWYITVDGPGEGMV